MFHIAVFNNKKVFLRKFLIFMVFSVIISLSFAYCGKTEEGKSAETETETLSEHVTETETSAATETYVTDDNFVTIGGVLTEYKGTDTVVTIPDYVTEIADRAFEDAPNAGKITEIRLGRGVTKISAKAFFRLDSLTSAVGNNYFSFSGGFLKGNLDTEAGKTLAYFDFSTASELDFYSIYEEVTSFDNISCEEGYIVFGEAVFKIKYSPETEVFDVTEVNVFKKDIPLLAAHSGANYLPISCAPTAETKVISAENMYIITDFIHGKAGSLWCVSKDGVYENHSFGSDENAYVLWFTASDDGLYYERWVKKYYNPTYVYDILEFCVSRDEFCSDKGKVTFEDADPIFSAEESFKVSDIYDLDEYFAQWTEATGQTDFENVDDLIEFNKNMSNERIILFY